jgi:hypothetical protein
VGLDITAYGHVELVPDHERTDDCWEAGHVTAYVIHELFGFSLNGLIHGRCYKTSGEEFPFRAGSYSGYGEWRTELERRAGELETGRDVGGWGYGPFYELLNFADNEGTIGPLAAQKLRDDFVKYRDAIAKMPYEGTENPLDAPADDTDWFMESYNRWQHAFELAAGTGLVDFH